MNNKYERVDHFLKVFRDVALENENLDFGDSRCQKMIYHYLVRLGVTAEQMQMDISQSGFFDAWITRFENVHNINCFVSDNWKYFCQFKNKDCSQVDHVKMYIPLASTHLYDGVNMIFDFLASNDIKHQSKIGKHIRFDNIVIRLTNKDDALKLAEFIKNNGYINEGLIPANPFTYSKDGIAYACDGYISYNTTVSQCINLYIRERKQLNKLDDISVTDFYSFLSKYYDDIFLNNDVNKFMNDFNVNINNADINIEFKNYKQVLGLIIKSANPDFGFEDYLNHFETCIRGDDVDYLRLPSQKDNDYITKQPKNDYESLLIEVIDKMSAKYGKHNAIASINSYLINGMSNHITRTDGLRQRVIDTDMRGSIIQVLKNNNLDFETYVQLLYEKKNDKSDKEIILESALKETYQKYQIIQTNTNGQISGRDYMINALKQLLLYNSYLGFTRNNGAREDMIKNITSKDVLDIICHHNHIEFLNEEVLNQVCQDYVDGLIRSYHKI